VAPVGNTKPPADIERYAIEELLRSIKSMAESQKQLVEIAESILAEARKSQHSEDGAG
jgi:hypothetical protein